MTANPPAVELVTDHAASADKLSDRDYRDIYDELRGNVSLRRFAAAIGSQVSIAWWGKYEAGQLDLSRARKIELRRAVGLQPLPPTIDEVAATISPEARVWRVGAGVSNRVVLVAGDSAPLTLRVAESVTILDGANAPGAESHVTPVTPPVRRQPRKQIHLSIAAWKRLNSARLRAGLTWDKYLSQLAPEEA